LGARRPVGVARSLGAGSSCQRAWPCSALFWLEAFWSDAERPTGGFGWWPKWSDVAHRPFCIVRLAMVVACRRPVWPAAAGSVEMAWKLVIRSRARGV